MPQQEIRIRGLSGKMHRQAMNLAKNKYGIPLNQFLIMKFKEKLDKMDSKEPLNYIQAATEVTKRYEEVLITGISELTIKRLHDRAERQYGLKANEFNKMLIKEILDDHSIYEKEKQNL